MLRNNADAHISSLGYLWSHEEFIRWKLRPSISLVKVSIYFFFSQSLEQGKSPYSFSDIVPVQKSSLNLNWAGDSKDATLSQSPSLRVSGSGSSHRKYKKIATSQYLRSRKILSSTCGHCLERRQFWAVCFTVIFGYFIFVSLSETMLNY